MKVMAGGASLCTQTPAVLYRMFKSTLFATDSFNLTISAFDIHTPAVSM